MKNRTYFFCALAFLFSCNQKKEQKIPQPIKQEQPVQPKAKLNPAILQNGSSFLEIFAAYWKLGQWQELINMTDQQSLNQFGKAALEKKYKKINLAMKLNLKSMVGNNDSTYTLNYQTTEFATKRMLRVTVRVYANGSDKLVVSDIDGLFR